MSNISIYLTSDFHFMHDKPFLYEPRGFSSPGEMSKEIVQRYNEIVTDNDDVYVLGDLVMSDITEGINYLYRLNGKIHVILGNHDSPAKVAQYKLLDNIYDIQYATMLKYKKYNFYLSHYPSLIGNFTDRNLKNSVINICGHSHTKDRFVDWDAYNGYIYHVELDAHDCRPVLLDDIIEDMKNKVNLDKCKLKGENE